MQVRQREDEQRFELAFQAWFEVARISAERKHQVAQAAVADNLHCCHVLRRALHAWIEGVSLLWKEKQCMAQRNTLFYRWHERARSKRIVPSRLRARFRLKASGWANEVCAQLVCSMFYLWESLDLCLGQYRRLVNKYQVQFDYGLCSASAGSVSCSQTQVALCPCMECSMAGCLAAPQSCTSTQGIARVSGSCC